MHMSLTKKHRTKIIRNIFIFTILTVSIIYSISQLPEQIKPSVLFDPPPFGIWMLNPSTIITSEEEDDNIYHINAQSGSQDQTNQNITHLTEPNILINNAHTSQQTSITANIGIYDHQKNHISFLENVRIIFQDIQQTQKRTITSDYAEYTLNTDHIIIKDHATLNDDDDNQLYGEEIIANIKTRHVQILGSSPSETQQASHRVRSIIQRYPFRPTQ